MAAMRDALELMGMVAAGVGSYMLFGLWWTMFVGGAFVFLLCLVSRVVK